MNDTIITSPTTDILLGHFNPRTYDAMQGVPVGTTTNNEIAELNLNAGHIMIDGGAGQGKSHLMRLLELAISLDPTVKLRVSHGDAPINDIVKELGLRIQSGKQEFTPIVVLVHCDFTPNANLLFHKGIEGLLRHGKTVGITMVLNSYRGFEDVRLRQLVATRVSFQHNSREDVGLCSITTNGQSAYEARIGDRDYLAQLGYITKIIDATATPSTN